jgi:hypothetical protein
MAAVDYSRGIRGYVCFGCAAWRTTTGDAMQLAQDPHSSDSPTYE